MRTPNEFTNVRTREHPQSAYLRQFVIPTFLLKELVDVLLPYLTAMINASIGVTFGEYGGTRTRTPHFLEWGVPYPPLFRRMEEK